ncbi:MAG: glycosyltransferase family 4 protein [Firmicutes bacterium]|nr:glycosyltransferase family 4 protein [Bacillota bacterium]
MKILMINHFPLAGSGSGTYTKNLAVQLAKRGHDVTIVLPENTTDFHAPDGVRLHPVYFTPEEGVPAVCPQNALPFNFPCFTSHPRSTVTFADLSPGEMEQYVRAFSDAIRQEVETNRPDVIHGQHVWILSSLAAGLGVPLVLTAHGTDLIGYDAWPYLRSYAARAMGECSAVIAISKDNEQLVAERFPDEADKIVRMRNGYDPGVFFTADLTREEVLGPYGVEPAFYDGKRIVLFAGKLAYVKGVDILLEAVQQYEQEDPANVTLIVGDGDVRADLEAQAKALDLKTVRFLGNVLQPALCRLYNIADVSVAPSRSEGFGLVAVEAMACGVPVVASDVGGLPGIVNDAVGALAVPEDPQSLADAVLGVLRREEEGSLPAWRKEIASYARTEYGQDTIIHELEELYETAIRG